MLMLLAVACTTVRPLQPPGLVEGELYAYATTWPFQRGFILRCTMPPDSSTTTCVRVLDSDRAGELAPYNGGIAATWSNRGEESNPEVPIFTAAPAVPQSRWVFIGSGGADIYIDGAGVGHEPAMQTRVTYGTHLVKAVLPDGRTLLEQIEVREDETLSVRVDAINGRIVVAPQ